MGCMTRRIAPAVETRGITYPGSQGSTILGIIPGTEQTPTISSAGDWYWEIVSDGQIVEGGLARTSAQARAQAFKVVASHAVREPGDSARSFKGPATTEAP